MDRGAPQAHLLTVGGHLPQPTAEEVHTARKRLRPGRAPGIDGIPSEVTPTALQHPRGGYLDLLCDAPVCGVPLLPWAKP